MHFVNRILHIQAAAQPPTPADKVRIIREEQQRGLIHLHVLCPQVMHFVNRILHIQAAAQPPTPADKLAMAHAAQQKWPRKATAV